jgi:hypothetical protein
MATGQIQVPPRFAARETAENPNGTKQKRGRNDNPALFAELRTRVEAGSLPSADFYLSRSWCRRTTCCKHANIESQKTHSMFTNGIIRTSKPICADHLTRQVNVRGAVVDSIAPESRFGAHIAAEPAKTQTFHWQRGHVSLRGQLTGGHLSGDCSAATTEQRPPSHRSHAETCPKINPRCNDSDHKVRLTAQNFVHQILRKIYGG